MTTADMDIEETIYILFKNFAHDSTMHIDIMQLIDPDNIITDQSLVCPKSIESEVNRIRLEHPYLFDKKVKRENS